MADTNGAVDPTHLAAFGGYPVSAAILLDLQAASADFHNRGYTFNLVLGVPGYRSLADQSGMFNDYNNGRYRVPPYYLSPPPSPHPAAPGNSRHGYGKAVDIYSNAPLATRDALMAAHNFRLWSLNDRNHYEWGNVLEPSSATVTPLDNTPKEDRMRILPQDDSLTYFLEVPTVGLWVIPNQTIADMVYRYLTQTANGSLTRADIDGFAAFIAVPPTYKAFYGGPTSSPQTFDYDTLTAKIVASLTPELKPPTSGTITFNH